MSDITALIQTNAHTEANMIRIPQVIVAWMFNIVAMSFLFIGALLRLIAEWIYGTPKTVKAETTQEGEMSVEDLLRIMEENYISDEDQGASQEGFEEFLEEEEKKNRKVH